MRKGSDDAGFTLIDMMVAMTIMTIVMAVFTAGIVQMYRAADDVDAKSVSQSQINIAMQRLDREVRYAKGIATPYLVSGNQYVDMLSIQRNALQAVVQQCIQLRVADGVLAQRTWTFQSNPLDITDWTPLAYGVTASAPFTYLPPSDTVGYQQLTVTLSSGTGAAKDANTATFIALNSDRTTGQDYCNVARGG